MPEEEKGPALSDVEAWKQYIQSKLGVAPLEFDVTPKHKALPSKDKSAFTRRIYDPFDPFYYQPYVSQIWHLMFDHRTALPNYIVNDAFMMFYKPYNEVVESLKEPQQLVWQKVVANAVSKADFQKLNRLTMHSNDLAIAAAYKFLQYIFDRPMRSSEADRAASEEDPEALDGSRKFGYLRMVAEDPASSTGALLTTLKDIEQLKEASDQAQSLLARLPGGQGFTHEALSVLHYLKKPDSFRKRVRLLQGLYKAFRFYSVAISPSDQKSILEATYGGVSGISVLRDLKQVVDLHLTELAMPSEILALRTLSGQATIRQRMVSFRPVVFVDKSGSMAGTLEGDVAKISGAAGLALALHVKLGADVYLFDVECHKVPAGEIIKTLMTVEADSGTDITEVLNVVKGLGRDRPIIILTDGIDDVDQETASRVAKTHKVTMCLLPYYSQRDWMKGFRVLIVRRLSDLAPNKLLKS